MARTIFALALMALLALPLFGQEASLEQAQQALRAAETAGALTYANTLYEDAQWRLRFAQENWNHARRDRRDQARLRAEEGLWAARAALAKAQWLSTNAAIRSLQADIVRFGGQSDILLQEESPAMEFNRGADSRARVDFAQSAIDQAKAAGAEQFAAQDLQRAEQNLGTARKIARGDRTSESADHLAYVAEMIARRAYYLARAGEAMRHTPPLQIERTRLAQAASEQSAAAERAQREAAERQAADLQRQLAVEAANRQAQTEEVERLRQQVEENRRAIEQRASQDRQARLEAERQLDEAMRLYESAISSGSVAEVERLRRQVEDQQIALRALQERERLNEASLQAEIERLRGQVATDEQLRIDVQRREEELQRLRRDREEDMARRMDLDRQQQATITEAQRRRQDAEAQAQELRMQVEQAQAAAQQQQAELERTRQQAQQAQAELERTRQELAAREADARRARMEQELARLATTRTDPRGLIVTLPGIFFDVGKADLKPGARNTLTKIVAQLQTDPNLRISIEGHTDSTGSEATNQQLSERRANAVRDFLVNAGLTADSITAAGRGESQPVATNNSASGRQQNRRVELIITSG
jgi:outer membrane protein OmpA-like peptidoglycan-associated protein